MKDFLQAILEPCELKNTLFPVNSRYHGINTSIVKVPEGKTIIYLQRRFISSPEQFSELQEHTVAHGDRIDNLSAQYLGDPQQFWRLCDANGVMRPEELTETIGRRIRITLPEGIPVGKRV